MEVKEEKTVIAKPVASRPTCSTFRSFSELLVGAINASPSNSCPETAVTAIRPKTVRFKPTANHAPNRVFSSQAEVSGAVVPYSSDAIVKSETKSTVVYKPLAKLVSKATVSLLANLGNSTISHQQALAQVEARAQPINQVKPHFRSDLGSNLHQNFAPKSQREKTIEPSKTASENLEDDQKSLPPSSSVDRPSYDGYNWRKYGQKQVKGSEYPRSYYKCTHPNCPVKKKVERSLDGQIAEIVYKGEHNHSKPQPPKRNTSGAQGQGVVSDGTGLDTNNALWSSQLYERNEGSDGRIECQNEVGLSAHSTYSGKAPLSYDPVAAGAFNTGVATPDNSCGLSGDGEEGSKVLEVEDDEPKSKRRRNENQSNEVGISGEGVQEPRIVVQNSTDSEIVGDGFRWRKYGQKVVKGNPYPRSYYRCTSLKCNVRKHVERASDDPRAFITTYEGTHNHDMPIRSTNPVASEPDSQVATSKDKL
ncbi:WRKY transcription factor 44-like [Cornus florida]|uniref:WRKY transcription factor 44-like n=1 Tax=Cornus florida TaxID=4283 RepID=UPI002899B25C|nr:WRKY transcription factor 44-like [Cornus florida]XP_059667728.1 WRKY transcription factor 44-like [Cornus florida]XP_059667729.1 WRKY transcription factor 44-like [Cornus florida]XP_059667730.1 WRKY transcription factor 44-like [Cornus florida]XP_059667731.1 WRKY transcription factor 44-like [Cornus florida]XP_059667732.1 WRKY transcription factor 44-like [Cornus florida]XP_059667733.1 WRKY transcription factor 44-like [Cornus florida]